MGECIKFGKGKLQIFDDVFKNNSWEMIIAACQRNCVPDTWKVGDQKTMAINGADYAIDIIGKNHDTYSDGSGTAPLTFQMHDCYLPRVPEMHSSGDATWDSCEMRTVTLPSLLQTMPVEVQNAVKEVNKSAFSGNGTSVAVSVDKVFLLSRVEIFGDEIGAYTGEGSQYEYYALGNSKVKTRSGEAELWWTRSRCTYATAFWTVNRSGEAETNGTTGAAAIAFAFCF